MKAPEELHVLLVEDDRDTRQMLAMGLQLQGYQVVKAPNGRVALGLLQAGPLPALVLLDRMMPEMDGLELLQRMGEDPRLADVPVVLLSGEEDLALSPRARRARRILSKPVGLPDLLELVRGYLGEA